jgi:hypothetical protein
VSKLAPFPFFEREVGLPVEQVIANDTVNHNLHMSRWIRKLKSVARKAGTPTLGRECVSRLLDISGILVTRDEYREMPHAVYTAIQITKSRAQLICRFFDKPLVLIINTLTYASQVLSNKGPGIDRDRSHTQLHAQKHMQI